MRMVIVVFHDPEDDKAGKLNECLKNKNAVVGPEDDVAYVKFPDGWLVVCYDRPPSKNVKQAIAAKIKEVNPEIKVLLVHDTTWKNSVAAQRTQQALTAAGGVLEGARAPQRYSHEVGNKFYDRLINMLTHSHLADMLPELNEGEKKTLREDFSRLKHELGRTLSAIDIDLQGLVASNFDAEYTREIVETYQSLPQPPVTVNVTPGGGATYAGAERNEVRSPVPLPHGRATKALERVRELVHNPSDSIRVVTGNAIQLINPDANHMQEIEQAWGSVEQLLPGAEGEPAEICGLLQSLETETGLAELAQQETPDKDFHEWFSALDEALNVLRDLTTAKIPADLNQTTAAK